MASHISSLVGCSAQGSRQVAPISISDSVVVVVVDMEGVDSYSKYEKRSGLVADPSHSMAGRRWPWWWEDQVVGDVMRDRLCWWSKTSIEWTVQVSGLCT